MKNNNTYLKEVAYLVLGELLVCALTVLGFFVSNLLFETGFTYRVFTGALLGAAVTVLNYLALIITVNRQIDGYLALRGNGEMTDEEAEKFTAEHSVKIQNSIKLSFIIRTFSMLAALVLAFLLDWFAPLATAIPLLAYRPILTVTELIRRRADSPAVNEEITAEAEGKESDE